jgi:multidrug efflux pump
VLAVLAAYHRALNFYLIDIIPKGFFPQQDTGVITGNARGPQDASFPVMDNSILQIEKVIQADPAVANVIVHTGTGNTGSINIALKPLNVRKVSAADVINRLRPKLNKLPVASAFLQAAQDLRIGGRQSNALYQYTIQSDNVSDLSHWGPILLAGNAEASRDSRMSAAMRKTAGLEELLSYDRPTARKAWHYAVVSGQSPYPAPLGSRKSQSSTRS